MVLFSKEGGVLMESPGIDFAFSRLCAFKRMFMRMYACMHVCMSMDMLSSAAEWDHATSSLSGIMHQIP
jgi:hypothetical protein